MKTISFLLLCSGLMFGCSKSDKTDLTSDSAIALKVSGVSGGCGDFLNIEINKEKTTVSYPKNACGTEEEKDRTYKTTAESYRQLVHYVESLRLMHAEINDCFRCVDGDDYIINITSGQQTNTITIGGYRKDDYKQLLDFLKKF